MRALNGWGARCLRLYRPDRNPLRRRCDRIEAFVVTILLLIGLVAVYPAVVVGVMTFDHGVATEKAGRWVHAVVVSEAPHGVLTSAAAQAAPAMAHVRWHGPGDKNTTALAPVPAGTEPGQAVNIWVDGSGTPGSGPQDRVTTVVHAVTTGLGTMIGAAALLCLAGALTRKVLDRRRLAEWEAEWTAADRHWPTRGA
ncbi:hypothetical protein SAMN05421505_10366 [Sinosporangium album]|uniref:Uncharacterized protein n=1 Tax=Sinosporangium album TaxID=504805 RepID=A0A1G7T1P7_9ACTN|nr:hypothetical protein [Sinosporangium album]SDG29266.1 hypothetical protein SAMN05421505_10366 [Sinosporangium album]